MLGGKGQAFKRGKNNMAHVVVTDGPLKGQRFEITKDITRIGRRAGNDWVLDASSISGTHCEIVRVHSSFLLRDLGSTNGTRLNGKRIQEDRLYRNDIITAGDETIMIDGDDVPASAESDAESDPIPRTTVMIRPQVTGNAKIVPPPDFRKRMDMRKLWIIIIALTGLAVLIAAIAFLRSEMIGS